MQQVTIGTQQQVETMLLASLETDNTIVCMAVIEVNVQIQSQKYVQNCTTAEEVHENLLKTMSCCFKTGMNEHQRRYNFTTVCSQRKRLTGRQLRTITVLMNMHISLEPVAPWPDMWTIGNNRDPGLKSIWIFMTLWLYVAVYPWDAPVYKTPLLLSNYCAPVSLRSRPTTAQVRAYLGDTVLSLSWRTMKKMDTLCDNVLLGFTDAKNVPCPIIVFYFLNYGKLSESFCENCKTSWQFSEIFQCS